MICGTPPGLHNIAQFSPPPPPPPRQNHTQREKPLHSSKVGLDQGLRGMCDLKRDRPKMQEHFARLPSMIALSCLIEDQQTFYPGRFCYVLIAVCNTDFRLTRFKLQVFIHCPKYLRKQWNRQYHLYSLAGTFFVSLIRIYSAVVHYLCRGTTSCTQALWYHE